MDKIEKVKEWVKKQKKETLARNSIGVITGKALFVDVNELLSFLDTLSEEPDKSLAEAAEEYIEKGRYLPEAFFVRPAFIAGAEWQASQMPMPEDTVLFNNGVAEGRRLEREDMLKDAVEGEVVKDISNKLAVTAKGINLDGFKFGDKVRIVVLKEEEE